MSFYLGIQYLIYALSSDLHSLRKNVGAMLLSMNTHDLLMAFFSLEIWRKAAVDVFSQWALIGKDEGMERGHAASVQAMLELALPKPNPEFSAIDLGCGNGWVHGYLPN